MTDTAAVTNFCPLCREERVWNVISHGWRHVRSNGLYCSTGSTKKAEKNAEIPWEKRRVLLEALGILHVQMRKAVNAIQEGKEFDVRIYTALEYADEQLSTYGFEFHSE